MSQSDDAVLWVKKNKQLILERFADPKKFLKEEHPLTIFMAGSPGAGKTETARALIKRLPLPVVHIDADAIRAMIPGFDGSNASVFQAAATVGVEKLYDHVLAKGLSVIVDTTFTPFAKARSNVTRSINKGRAILIIYVYQDPVQAWKFTKARELVEGRVIPRTSFIKQFLEAPHCVNRMVRECGEAVQAYVVRKDVLTHKSQEYFELVQNIENVMQFGYTVHDLERLLS
ncbi:hypothetical protein A2880_02155 [Candidatus Peribacteria bacterium RIFCSPHIGHO2_01_FULL_49_38]|nr:MAG: hypothetical protein A2880_02155 [Candidatus Peribacteria bacterium RIFCSPHIGHO2_01_FULL_49_38]